MKAPAAALLLLAGFGFTTSPCARGQAPAAPEPPPAQRQLARDIFRELIEIDTVTATGDTARAADAMAARLLAAGWPAATALTPAPPPQNPAGKS